MSRFLGSTHRRIRQLTILPIPFLIALIAVMLLIPGTTRAADHPITAVDNNVAADGNWTGQVAAGGAQNWTFTLSESREADEGGQLVAITNLNPSTALLNVSIDGQELGTVGNDTGAAVIPLGAGVHTLTISNPGSAAVTYDLYLGHFLSVGPVTPSARSVPAGAPGSATYQWSVNCGVDFPFVPFASLTQLALVSVSPSPSPGFITAVLTPGTGTNNALRTIGVNATATVPENTYTLTFRAKCAQTHFSFAQPFGFTSTITKSKTAKLFVTAEHASQDSVDIIEDKLDVSLDDKVSSRASAADLATAEAKLDTAASGDTARDLAIAALEGKADTAASGDTARDQAIAGLETKADTAASGDTARDVAIAALDTDLATAEAKLDTAASGDTARDLAVAALEGKADAHAIETGNINDAFEALVANVVEMKRVHLQVISIRGQGQKGSRWLLGSTEAGVPVDVNLISVQGTSANVSGPLSLSAIAATALTSPRAGTGVLELEMTVPEGTVILEFQVFHEEDGIAGPSAGDHFGTSLVHMIGGNNLGAGQ